MSALAHQDNNPGSSRDGRRSGAIIGVLGAFLLASTGPATAQTPVGNIAQVAAGYEHSCAITTAGGVLCWGKNQYGQLGDRTTDDRLVASNVYGLDRGATAIAVGLYNSCALVENGVVKCWGFASNTGVATGSYSSARQTPQITAVGEGNVALAAGLTHTCAVHGTGTVKCWGSLNGLMAEYAYPRPAPVPKLDDAVAVAIGYSHSCALTRSGGVKCWGSNTAGQLGDGTNTTSLEPVEVVGLASGVKAIAAADDYSCALTTDGKVKCWGGNADGQLGSLLLYGIKTPLTIAQQAGDSKALSVGAGHVCTVQQNSSLQCWGSNRSGQIGIGVESRFASPTAVPALGESVQSVSAGSGHTCAVLKDGQLRCWGRNTTGGLGDGRTTNRPAPAAVLQDAGYQSGWYWNAAESGRGFFVEIKNNVVVLSGFLYANDGTPTWFLASGRLEGNRLSAPMQTYSGGQTLTSAYRPPRQTGSLGDVTLEFIDRYQAKVSWPGGSTTLTRFRYADDTMDNLGSAVLDTGWWWNPAESGRGFAIETQGTTMFIVAYHYDDAGQPVWSLAQGQVNKKQVSGRWERYANGQSIGGTYRKPQITDSSDTFSFDLYTANEAMLTLPDGRKVKLERFKF